MATLATLFVEIAADARRFDREWAKIERRFMRTGGRLKALGTRLTMGLTLPIVAVGMAAGKSAMEFESAFTGVRKTVDATEEQYADLSRAIRDMSKTIPATAVEISRVAEAAGQLGIQRDAILGFSRVMIDLGESTNMASDEAATALARLANITQMPQREFGRLGSVIVDLGNNLATTEGEIVEMGLRLAGAGHQVGLTQAQILGFAGALSSVGIQAEAGGTAFSRVVSDMASASGKRLGEIARIAGMTGAQFRQAFERDAAGAVVAVVEGLGRLSKSGENVFQVLQDVGWGNIRVRDTLLRASGAGDLLRKALDLGSEAWVTNTALTIEAEKRYRDFNKRLKIFRNKLVDIAVTLGGPILESITKIMANAEPLLRTIQGLVKWFSALPAATQQSAIQAVALVAALGPLLYVMGTMVTSGGAVIGFLRTALGALVKFAPAIGGAISSLGAFFSLLATEGAGAVALLNPIGIVIAAIALKLAILYTAWRTNFLGIRDITAEVWGWVKPYIIDAIAAVRSTVSETVAAIRNEVQKAWGEIAEVTGLEWDEVRAAIATVVRFLRPFIEGWLTAAVSIFKSKLGLVTEIVRAAFAAVRLVVTTVLNVLTTYLRVQFDLWTGIFKFWSKVFQGDWAGAWGAIRDTVVKIFGHLKTFLGNQLAIFEKAGGDLMRALGRGIANLASMPYKAVRDVVARVRRLLPSSDPEEGPLRDLTQLGRNIPLTLAAGIREAGPALAAAAAEAMGPVLQLADDAGKHWAAAAKTGQDALSEWGRAGQAVMDSVRMHFEDALFNMVKGMGSLRDFWGAVWDDMLKIALHALVNTVLGAERAANAIAGLMSKAMSWLTAAFGPTGGLIAGVAGLFGLNKIFGGLFGGGGGGWKDLSSSATGTNIYPTGAGAGYTGGLSSITTASVAAQPTRVVSVAVRMEEGAIQLSPETFDQATAREAALAMFEEIKRLFEAEDLTEGLAQA